MDKTLATKLLAKNLITETTEIVARYKGSSISGDVSVTSTDVFSVQRVLGTNQEGTIFLQVQSTRDGSTRTVTQADITEIDGMEPNRFASVYNIKADGSAAAVGKRRGRKPKDRSQSAE